MSYVLSITTESVTMSLTRYRTLGRSGLVVSPLALGTMTFGADRWGADQDQCRAIFDAYVEAGGNLIDTADIYSAGASEEMVGRFIADTGLRDQLVLATKFGFNAGSSPLTATAGAGGNPHAGGAGGKHIHQALDASLRRLQTDYIDLYWMHIWDGVTPVEEIVQVLSDLVRAGKIRYYGLSDMPAWMAAKAATLSAERGLPRPIAMQVEYSLVARDIEREHVPAALDAGMGVVPWSPLAGGFLTGKYDRGQTPAAGRLSGANPFGDSKLTEHNYDILDVVRQVADEVGATPAQTSLAWVSQQRGVSTTLVGASSVAQLHANLVASDITLTAEQLDRLTAASALTPGFSDSLAAPEIRTMLFGGHDVVGWDRAGG